VRFNSKRGVEEFRETCLRRIRYDTSSIKLEVRYGFSVTLLLRNVSFPFPKSGTRAPSADISLAVLQETDGVNDIVELKTLGLYC